MPCPASCISRWPVKNVLSSPVKKVLRMSSSPPSSHLPPSKIQMLSQCSQKRGHLLPSLRIWRAFQWPHGGVSLLTASEAGKQQNPCRSHLPRLLDHSFLCPLGTTDHHRDTKPWSRWPPVWGSTHLSVSPPLPSQRHSQGQKRRDS